MASWTAILGSITILAVPKTTAKKLRIVEYPDPVLKKRCATVTAFDDNLRSLAKRMIELMHEAKGVGLAAPQVGVSVRLFVFNPTVEPGKDVAIVNPKFVEAEGAEEQGEGCLSLPGVTVTMRRATRVVLDGLDLDGRPMRLQAEGLPARIWQHEVDHLDGKLIIDQMSTADEIANRRAIKQMLAAYKPPKKAKR